MEITVLVEPMAGSGFRASGGPPLGVEAVGATRDEALDRLRSLIADRIAAGAELVPLHLGPPDAPRLAGLFRDDPLFDAWQEAIAASRRRIDADPEQA